MLFRVALLSAVFALSAVPALAAAAPTHPVAHPEYPWVKDSDLAEVVLDDVHAKGFDGVAPHVAEIEAALAGAPHAFGVAAKGDKDGVYVLTTEEAGPAVAPASPDPKRKAFTAINPDIELSFFIGTN